MTLPIIEAILRGDFRPTLIKETVPAEELSQMMHTLRQAKERTNLIELRKTSPMLLTAIAKWAYNIKGIKS